MGPVGDRSEMVRAILDTLESPLPSEILRRRAEEFGVDRGWSSGECLSWSFR